MLTHLCYVEAANAAPPSKTLKRTGRLESTSRHTEGELFVKKKTPSSPNQTKRKPTLIRNLGGSNAPKGQYLMALLFQFFVLIVSLRACSRR